MSQSAYHFKLISMTMSLLYSNGLSTNRAPLGCGEMGDSHHGCSADKSAATVRSSTSPNLCHKELKVS